MYQKSTKIELRQTEILYCIQNYCHLNSLCLLKNNEDGASTLGARPIKLSQEQQSVTVKQ